jgi:hypothetical protein
MKHLHPVFPVIKLELAKPDPITGQQLPPPPEPEVIDGEVEYTVDQVLDSRVFRRKLQYKVRWKDYGSESDSWEPAENLEHAQQAVAEFHQKHPSAPRQISSLGVFEADLAASWHSASSRRSLEGG